MKNNLLYVIGFIIVATVVTLCVKNQPQTVVVHHHKKPKVQLKIEKPEAPKEPKVANISVTIPPFQTYQQIVQQCKTWNQEAPDLTELGTYGASARGKTLTWIKLTNKYSTKNKKTVLIHACIHGNEPLATSTEMAYIGSLLSEYGKTLEVTNLLDTRTIYFIPVVNPDSYPNSREVEGVDPNREFLKEHPAHSIQELKTFFLKIKPQAAMSMHTSGRMELYPFGDKVSLCQNYEDYRRILGQMSQLNGYSILQACRVYGRPIFGGELDWYYRNQAFSMVMELGTIQRPPSNGEINTEFNKTWKSFLYFIKEGVKVQIKSNWFYSRAA